MNGMRAEQELSNVTSPAMRVVKASDVRWIKKPSSDDEVAIATINQRLAQNRAERLRTARESTMTLTGRPQLP
jgi:hypothetical protein